MNRLMPRGEYKGVKVFEDWATHQIVFEVGIMEYYVSQYKDIEKAHKEFLRWRDRRWEETQIKEELRERRIHELVTGEIPLSC